MANIEIEDMKSKINEMRTLQKEMQEIVKDEAALKQVQEGLTKLEHDTSNLKEQYAKFVDMTKSVPEGILLYELYKSILEQEIASRIALPGIGTCDKLGGKLILKKEAEGHRQMLEQLKTKLKKVLNDGIEFKS